MMDSDLIEVPVLLPDKFDGNQNFDDWVSHFECISKINGWNDDQKVLWLRVCMAVKAHMAYNRFSHEIQNSYGLMRATLKERFEPASKRDPYKIQLESRTKCEEENWADFGDDLCFLADKAYPKLSDEAKEQLALFRFFKQLQQPEMSLAVRQRKPKTVRDAVIATLEFESYTQVPQPVESPASPVAINNEQPIHQL